MSYQEKKIITSMISGIILVSAYSLNAWNRFQTGTAAVNDPRVWAGMMLRYIGIGIIITILLQILFHILVSIGIAIREKTRDTSKQDEEIERAIKQEMVEDERDKLIELKSMRIGFILVGIGFLASLGSVVLSFPIAVMLNILFFSFFLGSFLESVVQLVYYRRGM
jgi:uncharacterized membrane protein